MKYIIREYFLCNLNLLQQIQIKLRATLLHHTPPQQVLLLILRVAIDGLLRFLGEIM